MQLKQASIVVATFVSVSESTVDVLHPYSLRATKPASPVLSLHDFAATGEYPGFFFWRIRLVIIGELFHFHFSIIHGDQDGARVSAVGGEKLVA